MAHFVPQPVGPNRPVCDYCGADADVCPDCMRTMSYYAEWGYQPVFHNDRCTEHCGLLPLFPFRNVPMVFLVPQTCTACRLAHPWRVEDHLEITGFVYEAVSLHNILSPQNVLRVTQYRIVRLGESLSSPEQRAAWADAAYETEIAFSEDRAMAEELRQRVLAPADGSF